MSQRRQRLVSRLPLRGLFAPAAAAFCAAAAITTIAPSASAQQRGFTADRLIIGPNPDDMFAVWRPHVADRTRFFFDGYADYIRRPIHTRYITHNGRVQAGQPAVVNNQSNLYLSAGTELIGRLSLSVTLPITVVNTTTGELPGTTQGVNLENFAVGDLRLDGRVLVAQNDSKSLRFGLSGTVFVATGNEKSFAGDGFGHGMLQTLFEQRLGPVTLVENLGAHFRNRHDLGQPGDPGRLSFSNEATFGVGAFVPFRSGPRVCGAGSARLFRTGALCP